MKLLNNIPADKLLHLIAGQIVFAIAIHFIPDVLICLGIVLVTAIVKEIADRKFEIPDIVATELGGVAMFLLLKIAGLNLN